ncbi:transmembrane protein 126A [Denticeps clupeoides]|uniref:Transmembrane protein 126A n=1 Tax=Denticeps clupeoides TaxID=299321 RepID=A0AAY4D680_9TELE|nr:transmembrane protein 126A [Denticeps clupeoides]
MSESNSEQVVPRALIVDMLNNKFEKLPDLDRKLFTYGPLYLGGNAGLAGLVANSFYRRVLNVSQARIASSLPMATLPFLTTVALYNAVVSNPILAGDLNCPSCALIRGALVGLVGGGLYPILLALPVNAGLAARYQTSLLPERGSVLRHWTSVSRPVLQKMRIVLVLQAFFGTYLASKHFEIYKKMLQIPDSGGEELRDYRS